jgi:hypothetical protein
VMHLGSRATLQNRFRPDVFTTYALPIQVLYRRACPSRHSKNVCARVYSIACYSIACVPVPVASGTGTDTEFRCRYRCMLGVMMGPSVLGIAVLVIELRCRYFLANSDKTGVAMTLDDHLQ